MLTVAVAFVTGLFTAVVAIYGQWASSCTALKLKNLTWLIRDSGGRPVNIRAGVPRAWAIKASISLLGWYVV